MFLPEKLAALALRKMELLAARARALLEENFQLVSEFMASRSDLDWRPPDAGTVTFPRRRTASAPAAPGAAGRLAELEEMRRRELVSEDEYPAKRREILEGL